MDSPRVVNDNGAWCWFQDERALVDPVTGTLVFGSIPAPEGPGGAARAGNVEVTVVDLTSGRSDVIVLHANLETDDHDVPALWRRRDGRWLAAYTKHKTDDLTRFRVSEAGDPRRWGPERVFDWAPWTGGRGVTYSNLHEFDGVLHCFARAVNDDQCAIRSDDDGETWTYAGKLFTRPKVGYVNGYTRYASASGRIDLITTDHHPRDYDNSIYHGYLAEGRLHASDGRVADVAALAGDAPDQAVLTTVVAAAVITARCGRPERAEDAFDRMRPVLDHRFLYARLAPGGGWRVHPLAHAGPGLLPHEQDYTGLAAIDPYDLDSLYLSTPIDPRDGTRLAHHEIFHGRTGDGGATWAWTPVTQDSGVDNLRPIVAPGDPNRVPLLWFRGSMASSQSYLCEIVLLDRTRPEVRS